ncbi:hypothetical protein HY384_03805 [Candidatus Daviesbacteria bacterium]|nr:hypothetical protein [Candidatus Daviesbacteria bacterium]
MPFETEPILTKKRVITDIPGFPVAIGAWGLGISNAEVLKKIPDDSSDVILKEDGLRESGFTLRYHPSVPMTFKGNEGKVAEEVVRAGVETISAVLEAYSCRGQDLDRLILTTSTPADIPGRPKGLWKRQIAEALGIPFDKGNVKHYYLACGGAAAAFLDTLYEVRQNPNLRKIVIASIEPLTYFVNPKKSIDYSVFSLGTSALAYNPHQVILYNGISEVIPDINGVFKSPETYTLPPAGSHLPVPEHYRVHEGGEKIFAVAAEGNYLKLPRTDSPYLEMYTRGTTRYFKVVVPPVVTQIMREYYTMYPPNQPKNVVDLAASHQPGRRILIDAIMKDINRALSKDGFPELTFRWVMDDETVQMGNFSSGTSVVALGQLINRGEITSGKRFNFTSFGIGSVVTSMNIALQVA